jgi:hypothetical protein
MYRSSQISVMHSTTIIWFSLLSRQFTRGTLISVKSNLFHATHEHVGRNTGLSFCFHVFAKASAGNIIRHRFTSCLELRIDVEIY